MRLLALLALSAGLAFAQEGSEATPEPVRPAPRPPRPPGEKPETVLIKKKVYSFALPADWVLLERDDPKHELAWKVLLPGAEAVAWLDLTRVEQGDARAWPYYQAEWLRKQQPSEKVEVRPKPWPRLVSHRTGDKAGRIDTWFPLSVRNNVFLLRFQCSVDDFPQAEADLISAARTFIADVELRPAIPKGYETSQKGIWLIARAPNVTASVAPIVRTLTEQEKRFRRDHGALPRSDAPLVALIHASKADGGKIEPRVAESESGIVSDEANRRLFAVPFAEEDLDEEGLLASTAQGLLFMAKYGDVRPQWLSSGECTVAQAEAWTGKPLPSLHETFVAWATTLKFHRLDELDEIHRTDATTCARESFFYVAALRGGKYRKQYLAFLDDYAESCDGPGAFARHLGAIDQEDLRAATKEYVSRIKPVKPK